MSVRTLMNRLVHRRLKKSTRSQRRSMIVEALEDRALMAALVGYDVHGQTTYGTEGLTATTISSGLSATGLTRGSIIGHTNPGGGYTVPSNAWGGYYQAGIADENGNLPTSPAFLTFSITVAAGYKTSLSSIDLPYRKESLGPTDGQWTYAIGAGSDSTPNAIAFGNSSGTVSLDLSTKSALQQINGSTTITFKVSMTKQPAGTPLALGPTSWYVNDANSGTGAADLVVNGTILGTPSISLTTPSSAYTGSAYAGASISISGGVSPVTPPNVSLEYYNANSAIPANSISTPTDVGTYWVRAVYAGNSSNNAVTTSLQSFQITPKTVTVTGASASGKTYDASSSATVSGVLNNVFGGDSPNVFLVGAFSNSDAAPGKQVTITLGGSRAGQYSLATTTTTATISPRSLSVNASVVNKTYDATSVAQIVYSGLSGFVGSETVTVTSPSTGTFTSSNAGDAIVVTASAPVLNDGTNGGKASNYTLATPTGLTGSISKLALTGNITAATRVYDGTSSATITNRTLSGVISGDSVSYVGGTASFSDAAAGTDKVVTATGLSLTGSQAGNYSVNSTATTTASITKLALTGSITAATRVYDATSNATITSRTLSGVISGDSVSYVGGTASFSDAAAGTDKVVTATGLSLTGSQADNYSVNTTATTTASITKLALIGSITAATRTYDATSSATLTSRTLSGVISGDSVSYVGGTANFSDAAAGTDKVVTATGLSLTGSQAGNYTVNTTATTTASINKLALTGSITVASRIYDGTTNATITSRTLSGVIAGDSVSYVGGTANFSDANPGNGKTVTAIGLSLTGSQAGNYTVNATAVTSASIFQLVTFAVTVNGNDTFAGAPANQRSQVTSLKVVFSESVVLASNPFSIVNIGLTTVGSIPVTSLIVTNPSNDQKTFVITFGAGNSVVTRQSNSTGSGIGNSLADGNYLLNIDKTKVTNLSGLNMTGQNQFGTTSTDNFFRLYGDLDGNGVVDANDYSNFKSVLNSNGSSAALDVNGDSQLNTTDTSAFSTNYGKRRRTY